MNLDFDFRKFQEEAEERLNKILSESCCGEQEEEGDDGSEAGLKPVDETYKKMCKVLDCPEMEKSHPYLYSLDAENINEDDKQKINEIYDLGVRRGVIEPDDEVGQGCGDGCCDNNCDDALCGGPKDALTGQDMTTQPAPKQAQLNVGCTVLYSAMKGGQVKVGEFYSNLANTADAQTDCRSQLAAQGYSDIRVMAVEQNSYAGGDIADMDNVDCSKSMYDIYNEDDSDEYEAQETGADQGDGGEEEKADNEEPSDGGEAGGEGAEDGGSAEGAGDEGGSEEDADSGDEKAEKSADDEGGENKEENGDGEGSDDTEAKTDPEDEQTTVDDGEDKPKLTAAEKADLKDAYTKLFKATLQKLKMTKCIDEMSLDERTQFYKAISDKWSKNDPSEFLSDKEQQKLNKTVVKADDEGEEDSGEDKDK